MRKLLSRLKRERKVKGIIQFTRRIGKIKVRKLKNVKKTLVLGK